MIEESVPFMVKSSLVPRPSPHARNVTRKKIAKLPRCARAGEGLGTRLGQE